MLFGLVVVVVGAWGDICARLAAQTNKYRFALATSLGCSVGRWVAARPRWESSSQRSTEGGAVLMLDTGWSCDRIKGSGGGGGGQSDSGSVDGAPDINSLHSGRNAELNGTATVGLGDESIDDSMWPRESLVAVHEPNLSVAFEEIFDPLRVRLEDVGLRFADDGSHADSYGGFGGSGYGGSYGGSSSSWRRQVSTGLGQGGGKRRRSSAPAVPMIFVRSSNDPENPFQCPQCNFIGKQRRYVTEHIRRLHSGKPYKCPHPGCGYATAGSNHLKRHRLVHTKEKPYHCDHDGCNFASAQLSHVKIHQRSHTGERPFCCPVEGCSYTAARKWYVTRHVRTMHQPPPAAGLEPMPPQSPPPSTITTVPQLHTAASLP